MSPSRGVRWSALIFVASLLLPAVRVSAQTVFEDSSPYFRLTVDPFDRTPRLGAMGRLQFVLEDAHNRINLWDLGHNPIGVIDADTVSTFELGPVTGSASTQTQINENGHEFVRQTYGAHDAGSYLEFWRRAGTTTYGATGSWTGTRTDVPIGDLVERRSNVGYPTVMPVIAGRLPIGKSARWQYAIRGLYASPNQDSRYRQFVTNGGGQFIDLDGTEVDPPNFFVPTNTTVKSIGVGGHIGYRATPRIQTAIGVDYVSDDMLATNDGFRYSTEVRETRPYTIGQFTVAGRSATSLEWGLDFKGWTADADQRYRFTTSSSTGTASNPLTGRGPLLQRKEEGTQSAARVRWTHQAFQLGAGFATGYRKVTITAPLNDPESFNSFLNTVFMTPGTDTLALPDSVVGNVYADHSVSAGGGAAWNSPWHHTLIGSEAHFTRSKFDQQLVGGGPRQVSWDVRLGAEYPASPAIDVRAGTIYRWEDEDDATRLNEYITTTGTVGLGVHPPGRKWNIDLAYGYDWTRADYDNPLNPRTSGSRFTSRLLWGF